MSKEYNDLAEIVGWWATEMKPQSAGIFFFTETNKHVISKISYYFLLSSLPFWHLTTQDITLVLHVGKNLPSRS